MFTIENDVPIVADHFRMVISNSLDVSLHVSGFFIISLIIILLVLLLIRVIWIDGIPFWRSFEIDEAEFGLGDQRIRLRPDRTDMQIAYKIWVELSTRKVGLPIDLNDDVIVEVYDSWYEFFAVTRELIKELPVRRFRRKETEKIIRLSIDVLNLGIRPHLTKWQARFRRWYEREIQKSEYAELHPQEIQRKFKEYEDLSRDLQDVNKRLINYRKKMYEVITNL